MDPARRAIDNAPRPRIQCPPPGLPAGHSPVSTATRTPPSPTGTSSSSIPGRLLAVAAVDHPGGAETTLLRLLSRLRDRGWQVTLTTPGRGPLRHTALAAGLDWESLAVGGLGRRTGAPALRSWPRVRRLAATASVVYLNGAVCGRLLPALSAGQGRRVLHIHDLVARVPRF